MKEKIIKFIQERKNVLTILGIALGIVIVGVLIIVIFAGNDSKDSEPSIKNTTEYLEDGKIEVTDFDINYNQTDKAWYLSMNINNSSDEEIDLKDYSLRLYEDETELVILPGTTLGIVPANSGITSIIVLEDAFKKTNYVEIFKNDGE